MDFNAALSGLQAATDDLGVISNNIANVGTTGFKGSRAEFADIYANSTLGSGSNAIGSGVVLAAVSQQFSQGQIEFTNNNLDLAINGQGFFVLSNNGAISYTRAGAFGIDKNGYLVDTSNDRLQGYLADKAGNISGAQGDLQLSNANLPPLPTSSITINVNFDAAANPPTNAFIRGFSPIAPPDPSTYNSSTATTIYDSLGNSHIVTSYFVKAHELNTWNVFVGIDGTDVTPQPASLPVGTPPVTFAPGEVPTPYTIVFDSTGKYIPNSTAGLPTYYGPGPVVSSTFPLSASGTLPPLSINDLILNGTPVPSTQASSDIFSTTDNAASSISLAAAINSNIELDGIIATVNPTVLDLGTPTYGNLQASNFTINGQQIIGTVTDSADLINLINTATPITGVVGSVNGAGHFVLTANNGRNIQVQTNGTIASGATFANFNLNGGTALNDVQKGTVSLTIANNQPIIVSGANPNKVGLVAGPQSGIVQTNSDIINLTNWSPIGGAAGPQNLSIGFGGSTQFGAPFSILAIQQNGYSTGQLSGVNIDGSGVVVAQYNNGQSLALGEILLANFGNVQGLNPIGNNAWVESFSSGPALIGAPGTANLGVIQSSSLEQSNVELTNELVNLITAQRNFQANAQSIKTADAITQAIINI